MDDKTASLPGPPRSGRLLRLFGVAVVLPVAVAVFVAWFQVKASLEEQAYAGFRAANALHGSAIRDRLTATETALLQLARDLGDQDDGAEVDAELAERVDGILLLAADGGTRLLYGTLPPRVFPKPVGQARAGRSAILRPPGSSELFMATTASTASGGKRVLARLVAGRLFGEQDQRLITTGMCVLEGLQALYCTRDAQGRLADLQAEMAAGTSQGPIRWTTDGVEYLGESSDLDFGAQFDSPQWTLVSSSEASAVYGAAMPLRWLLPGFAILAVVCLLIFVVWQTRGQRKALAILRKGATSLAAGNFDTRVQLDSGDDLEQLGKSFNDMAAGLESRFNFLVAMSEVDNILLSSTDVVHVAESIVCRLPDYVPASLVSIYLCDSQELASGQLYMQDEASADKVVITSTRLNDTLARVLQRADDYLRLDPREEPAAFFPQLPAGIQGLHLFPLRLQRRVLGFLCLGSSESSHIDRNVRDQSLAVAGRMTVALAALERQQRLYEQAHFDGLTGLPNRSLFLDRLSLYMSQAARRDKQVAIIYVDLDQFKVVNDTLGHAQGDEVLRQAAERFRSRIRKSDTVARLSGDEFIFALPDLSDIAVAVNVVESIIESLEKPFRVLKQNFVLGASFGIAIYPQDGSTAEDMLRNADVAMYRAKAESGNQYRFFEETMNEEIVERVAMGQHLRQAVSKEHLQLAYQPKVSADSQRLHSVEALLRWNDAQLGSVNPQRFVPVAEESGLIERVGEFVINTACEQFAAWRQQGYSIQQVAVNFSPRQVLHTNIVSIIAHALEQSDIPAACLELELTESLLVADFPSIQSILRELHSLGVGMALDDFGTGYSSLSYLHQLPFDTLKIDKSFVQELGTNPDMDAIVGSIITLAKSLDKKVVAEGIETELQRRFLLERGCELMQGYLFSKPLPAAGITELLKLGRPLPLDFSDWPDGFGEDENP